MLHSALESCHPIRLEIHLLHPEDLPKQTLQRLQALVEGGGGVFHPSAIGEEAVRNLPDTWYFPKIIWYRSFLPQLRPELDRILYLDCDTLIVDTLQPLWETDLEKFRVAAVLNLIVPELATRHHSLGIPPGQPYFNSGMLLMNLDRMRREHCIEQLFDHAARYAGQSVWPDQDSLNYVLGPECLFVHPRWNCQNSFFYWPQATEAFGEAVLAEATRSPAILHFEGPPETKPWHYLNDHPYRERYWRHLRAIPWPTPSPSGRTLKNILRRYLPAAGQAGLSRLSRRVRRVVRAARRL